VTPLPIDLHRGHDGLSAVVRSQWGDQLFAGHLFVFFGRRFDRCKILFWDRGGLVLYDKRLERGRFRPLEVSADGKAVEMDGTDLAMLLDGIDVRRVRRPKMWTPIFDFSQKGDRQDDRFMIKAPRCPLTTTTTNAQLVSKVRPITSRCARAQSRPLMAKLLVWARDQRR
jgi:transposase